MDKDAPFDFSQAMGELDEINRWFQNEEIDLDVGLSKFRRGLQLIKKCRDRLKQVENEFIDIKKEFISEGNEMTEIAQQESKSNEDETEKSPF